MRATPNPKLATTCINRARAILDGKIDLPAVHYDGNRSGIHLSDLQGCPLRTYYDKIYGKDAPPNPDTAILHFVKGRGMERFFAEEQEGVTVDDISCTADGLYKEHGYLEFKATAEQMDFFDPLTAHPDWLERILGYTYAYNQPHWNLVVFFIVGNMPNKLWWNIREFGKSTEPYQGIALKAWRLSFSEAEIVKNWDIMLDRKRRLEKCLKAESPPSTIWVKESIENWMCKTCNMSSICYYLEPKNKDESLTAHAGWLETSIKEK